jgi:hypothetical protein
MDMFQRLLAVLVAGFMLAACASITSGEQGAPLWVPLPSGDMPATGDALNIKLAKDDMVATCDRDGWTFEKDTPCGDKKEEVEERQRNAQAFLDKEESQIERKHAKLTEYDGYAKFHRGDNDGCYFKYVDYEYDDEYLYYKSGRCSEREKVSGVSIDNSRLKLISINGQLETQGRTNRTTDDRTYERDDGYDSRDRYDREPDDRRYGRSLEVEIAPFEIKISGDNITFNGTIETVTAGARPVIARFASTNSRISWEFDLYLVTYDGLRVYICRYEPSDNDDAFDCPSVHASSDRLASGPVPRSRILDTSYGRSQGSVQITLSRPSRAPDEIIEHRVRQSSYNLNRLLPQARWEGEAFGQRRSRNLTPW